VKVKTWFADADDGTSGFMITALPYAGSLAEHYLDRLDTDHLAIAPRRSFGSRMRQKMYRLSGAA
jgi:hypothetical protein